MKRTLSSAFVPLDLRKILACITPHLIEDDFERNVLTVDKKYNICIYSDPTLEDGECQLLDTEKGFQVYLCSNQYQLLSVISHKVLRLRTEKLGNVDILIHHAPAKCTFKHDIIICYRGYQDDHIVWSVNLQSFEFNRSCYYGRCYCSKVAKIPKEQLKWNEGEQCRGGKFCRCSPYCKTRLQCETHPLGEGEEEKCAGY